MTALIATDLDRTMIYSQSAFGADTSERCCVEWYDGAPLSFMTRRAVTALKALAAAAPVVPVTTRTRTQFERIDLPGGPFGYAVVSNGGRILRDGHDDTAWRAALERRVSHESASLSEVHDDLRTRIDESWVRSTRLADDLFAYLVVDVDRQPADFVETWRSWAAPRGWSISQQGRKIYAMPVGVTKSAAVAEVRARLIADGTLPLDAPLLAAGDGRLDADLLEYADSAARPAHGELHDAGWSPSGLHVTTASGIAAGEEILAWFTDHLHRTPAPSSPEPAPAEN